MSNSQVRTFEDELLALGIDPSASQGELRLLRDIGLALRRSWRPIALSALGGAVLAYAVSFLMEVRYTSVAQVMIETRVAPAGDFTPVVTNIPTTITSLESELEVLRSVDLIGRIVDRFDLVNDPEFSEPISETESDGEAYRQSLSRQRERAIATVARRSAIEQVGTVSAVYAISFSSNDAEKAPRLANALAEEYVAETRMAKLRSLELSQGWLVERTRELNDDLSDLSVRLEQNSLSAPYSADEIETIKARNVAAERSLAQVERELTDLHQTLARVRELGQQGQLRAAAQAIAAPAPALAAALALVEGGASEAEAGLERELTAEVERLGQRLEQLEAQARSIGQERSETGQVLELQARRDAESRRIENEIAVVEAIYRDFMTQLSRRTEQERFLDADARLISTARPPLNPSQPRRSLMAAAGLIGIALMFVLAVAFREMAQTRMRNIRELEQGTGLPLIGVIPEVKATHSPFATFLGRDGAVAPELMRFARKLRWSILAELPGDKAGRLSVATLAEEPASRRKARGRMAAARGPAEAGGAAASGYGAGGTEPAHTVIAGASANRGDGQSSAMLALACSFADGGEKVLLIDCDFGNSPFAAMLSETDANLEYIRFDPRKAKQFIVETAYENLDVLPAPKAAVEATQKIGAAEWWRLFRHLSTQYDRILLDTPPLMSGIDTAVLHQVADVVLLFARWNATTTGETRSMIKVLGDVGVTPLAVVATRLDLEQVRGYGDDALFYLGRSMTA